MSESQDDFGGLGPDRVHLLDRRGVLRLVGGIGLTALMAGCRPQTTSSAAGGSGSGIEIPDETPGPFPADGSNGPNLLADQAVVRSNITSSIGGLSGQAVGIPTAIELTVIEAATDKPMPGAAVYLWQCTAGGQYSIYEIRDQNYLRGVQAADDSGLLTFRTVFPGCYPGRWPHCHFEVYESLERAGSGANAIKVSQLALPKAACEEAYVDPRYPESASSLARLSLPRDGVFADGFADQLAEAAGSAEEGYRLSLLVRV